MRNILIYKKNYLFFDKKINGKNFKYLVNNILKEIYLVKKRKIILIQIKIKIKKKNIKTTVDLDTSKNIIIKYFVTKRKLKNYVKKRSCKFIAVNKKSI